MKRIFWAAFLTLPILVSAVFGCQVGGKKTHLIQDNQYLDAQARIKPVDNSEGFLDLLWNSFFE